MKVRILAGAVSYSIDVLPAHLVRSPRRPPHPLRPPGALTLCALLVRAGAYALRAIFPEVVSLSLTICPYCCKILSGSGIL